MQLLLALAAQVTLDDLEKDLGTADAAAVECDPEEIRTRAEVELLHRPPPPRGLMTCSCRRSQRVPVQLEPDRHPRAAGHRRRGECEERVLLAARALVRRARAVQAHVRLGGVLRGKPAGPVGRAALSLDAWARGPVGGVPAGSSILACISVLCVGATPL